LDSLDVVGGENGGRANSLSGIATSFGMIGLCAFMAAARAAFARVGGEWPEQLFMMLGLCVILSGQYYQIFPILWALLSMRAHLPLRPEATKRGSNAALRHSTNTGSPSWLPQQLGHAGSRV
jgi:hypothetical protein